MFVQFFFRDAKLIGNLYMFMLSGISQDFGKGPLLLKMHYQKIHNAKFHEEVCNYESIGIFLGYM